MLNTLRQYLLKTFREPLVFKQILKEYHSNNNLPFKLREILRMCSILTDNNSKKLFIELLTKKPTSQTTPQSEQDIIKIQCLKKNYGELKLGLSNLPLSLLDFTDLGYLIRLNTTIESAASIFIQRKYQHKVNDLVCKPEAGDTVLEMGSSYGDTTLYFSLEVGQEGKVHSFAATDYCAYVYKHNINLNPHLSSNIYVADDLRKMTIDNYIKNSKLSRVDFIKLDMTYSPLSVLAGARDTFKKFKPKVVLGFREISHEFISALNFLKRLPGYQFYLSQCTLENPQILLFAMPRSN